MNDNTDRYVDELRLGFARVEVTLEAILEEAQKTNGRVTKLEDDRTTDARIRKLEAVYQYALGVMGALFVIGTLIGALIRTIASH